MRHFPRYWTSHRLETRCLGVFFDLHVNKRLSNWWRRRWIEIPLRSLWLHCNVCWTMPAATVLPSCHYSDVIMGAMASQITILIIVYSTLYSGVDQRKHQSSASLAFVQGIHRWPVNSPHNRPVTRKMFPFDNVIMVFIGIGDSHYHSKLHLWWFIVNHTQGTNFSEIVIANETFSIKKLHLKMSSAKWQLFCLGLNVLTSWYRQEIYYD